MAIVCFFKIISDNQCLSKPKLAKLKDELVLAVRRKDFVKAEEIIVKIDKIENEADDLKNKGKKILKSNLFKKYVICFLSLSINNGTLEISCLYFFIYRVSHSKVNKVILLG